MPTDFEIKYDQYGEMLYKIAFLYFGNAEDTEDALQEVFMKLLYAAPRFHSEAHEKAWLIRTTQNKCRDMLRRSSRKDTTLDGLPLAAKDDDCDTKLDVRSKIIALPPQYKTVVILYYYYDYSVGAIANTLRLSTSAVKMRLKRARELLKIELEGYGYE